MLLSYLELRAYDSGTVGLVIGARTRSARNLAERGTGTLLAVEPDATVYVKLRTVDGPLPVSGSGEYGLGYFLLAVDEVRRLVVERQSPVVLRGWYGKVFEFDLFAYIRAAVDADEDYYATLAETVSHVLDNAPADAWDNVEAVADYVTTLATVARVEVLPFHQMGRDKWDALGMRYELGDTRPPTPELVERVRGQFRARGLEVH